MTYTNEQLQKTNIELDNFVYKVSHDLRAPIASVLGLVNLAKREDKADVLREYFNMIGKSAEQQDIFIKDILDLSRNVDIVKQMGLNAREYLVKHLDRRDKLNETLELLKRLVKE